MAISTKIALKKIFKQKLGPTVCKNGKRRVLSVLVKNKIFIMIYWIDNEIDINYINSRLS